MNRSERERYYRFKRFVLSLFAFNRSLEPVHAGQPVWLDKVWGQNKSVQAVTDTRNR